MLKSLIRYIAYLIEEKQAIRRFIILTCYPVWLILSVVIVFDFVRKHQFDMSFATFYGTFTSVVAVAVGFYFYVRGKCDCTTKPTFMKGKQRIEEG